MMVWIEPAHDTKRCGFAGRAGKIFWVWKLTVSFHRLRKPQ